MYRRRNIALRMYCDNFYYYDIFILPLIIRRTAPVIKKSQPQPAENVIVLETSSLACMINIAVKIIKAEKSAREPVKIRPLNLFLKISQTETAASRSRVTAKKEISRHSYIPLYRSRLCQTGIVDMSPSSSLAIGISCPAIKVTIPEIPSICRISKFRFSKFQSSRRHDADLHKLRSNIYLKQVSGLRKL